MVLSRKKLGLLHVAKKRLCLSDEDYRAILKQVAGVESGRDLDPAGFDLVMYQFDRLGFRSDWLARNLGNRPGMASPQQVAKMRLLWSDYTLGEGTDASLDKWIERKFKVSSIRFLTDSAAHRAVGGLHAMVTRKRQRMIEDGQCA